MPTKKPTTTTLKHKLDIVDLAQLARLCGSLDANLQVIAKACQVNIKRRGSQLQIIGLGRQCELASQAVHRLQTLTAQKEVSEIDLHLLATSGISNSPNGIGSINDLNSSDAATSTTIISPKLKSRRGEISGRTNNQGRYIQSILDNDICFGVGPAGTGKTYLAVAAAVDALEQDQVKRLILTRPAVEAGERLGFLPGDLSQKVDPYLRPLYDALYDLLGFEKTGKYFEKGMIEIAPLAYMRGRSLNHAFIILDEAQNTTQEQMKMFLTRLGHGSKAVVTGDLTQIDLPNPKKCGLAEAVSLLEGVKGIAITHLTKQDVVRHPVVARIIEAYEKASN